MVTVPLGLVYDTREAVMAVGNGWRHNMGMILPSSVGTKWTPPIPVPEASQAPIVWGGSIGISSAMRVGRAMRLVASHRQSLRDS